MRKIVRTLYQDFSELGYLAKFEIDVPAKTLKTKDILFLADPNGLLNRGVIGLKPGG